MTQIEEIKEGSLVEIRYPPGLTGAFTGEVGTVRKLMEDKTALVSFDRTGSYTFSLDDLILKK